MFNLNLIKTLLLNSGIRGKMCKYNNYIHIRLVVEPFLFLLLNNCLLGNKNKTWLLIVQIPFSLGSKDPKQKENKKLYTKSFIYLTFFKPSLYITYNCGRKTLRSFQQLTRFKSNEYLFNRFSGLSPQVAALYHRYQLQAQFALYLLAYRDHMQ